MSSKMYLPDFQKCFLSALQEFLSQDNETGLERAYELGREAIAGGLGVLDVTSAYQESVQFLLSGASGPEERAGIGTKSAAFFSESLSPFEMTHRSYREANASLLALNEALEKRVEERTRKLEDANRELEDFAYIVSHDLKAPLIALHSIAALLRSRYSEKIDDDGKELLSLLTSRTTRMQHLIDGVLQYSKAGWVGENAREVDLNILLREVVEMLDPPPHIQIESATLPTIVCQKTRIQQVFQNLLSNAVKFMDKPQGKIVLSCTDDGPFRRFDFADNGRGIDAADLNRIFQLFVSVNSPGNGLCNGIGLAVVKKIVEMHGGRIWVESIPGAGSTFAFTLPKEPIAGKDPG